MDQLRDTIQFEQSNTHVSYTRNLEDTNSKFSKLIKYFHYTYLST